MDFNVHKNVTANGHVIVPDMRVRTNEWEEGVVQSGDDVIGCCGDSTHNGQVQINGVWYTDHQGRHLGEAFCKRSLACRHNHWFTVKYDDGRTKNFDGERLWKL